MIRIFNIGDIYEDCSYHPVRCTEINYEGDDISGVSLLDGSGPRSCSLTHCGIRKLTRQEAAKIVKIYRKGGNRALMRNAGWSNRAIDDHYLRWGVRK